MRSPLVNWNLLKRFSEIGDSEPMNSGCRVTTSLVAIPIVGRNLLLALKI